MRDLGSIPGSGRSPGEGIGYPLQYLWASLVTQLVKNPLQCGRPGFDIWVRRSPRGGNGNPLQYSGLENPMDRGPWQATVHGVAELNITERLSLQKHFIICDCELHFVAVAAKSFQSCPTLCDPTDCSPPGSSFHGISQARILEWVAISSSRGSSRPKY